MQFEKDLWRRLGRTGKAGVLADVERIELIEAAALQAEISSASLAVHRAKDRDRSLRLVEQARMLRELARRTGDIAALTRAAAVAERAVRLSNDARIRVAAKIEQAAACVLTADLFADSEAADAASGRLARLESEETLNSDESLTVLGLRARLLSRAALADNDLNAAVEAAGLFDDAVERSDERVRESGEGLASAAALRLHRADLLIGFGLQLKEAALLRQAEQDLSHLVRRLDRDRLPISWARAEALRGQALNALGDLEAGADLIASAVAALNAAVEHLPERHSPLDTARMAHALGHALMTLGEACDEERLFDLSVNAFDQALKLFETAANTAQRPICAFDRADAIARRAERRGDLKALAYAESALKAELAFITPAQDALSWAVLQVALARIYMARNRLKGGGPDRSNAMLALTEALEVFTDRGMRSLAETTLTSLEQLKLRA